MLSANAHHCYGIITKDIEKAYKKICEICENEDVLLICKSSCGVFAETKDGHVYKWINPSGCIRGYRLHKAWVDKNIDMFSEEFFYAVRIPASLYMDITDIEWF